MTAPVERWVHYYEYLAGEADGGEGHGWLYLRWDPAQPFEVSMHFDTGVVWRFGRSLYLRGLAAPYGEGDVRFDPYSTRIACALVSRDERALLLLERMACDRFAEHIRDVDDTIDQDDLDAAIAKLQRGDRR